MGISLADTYDDDAPTTLHDLDGERLSYADLMDTNDAETRVVDHDLLGDSQAKTRLVAARWDGASDPFLDSDAPTRCVPIAWRRPDARRAANDSPEQLRRAISKIPPVPPRTLPQRLEAPVPELGKTIITRPTGLIEVPRDEVGPLVRVMALSALGTMVFLALAVWMLQP